MMTARDILTDEGLVSGIREHVMSWFPHEACGLLVEGSEGATAVLAENLADKYHKLDPAAYPRTAERAYLLDPMLIANVERAGDRVVAIFHSHVRVGAYFSDEDVAQATSPFEDGPLYPGVDYVVFDAQDAGVKGHKVFAWNHHDRGFVEK
jgi:proteasome lid subunit RPN8/RPN11